DGGPGAPTPRCICGRPRPDHRLHAGRRPMTVMPPDRLLLDRLATPIGDALLVTDGRGRLRALDWTDHEPRLHRLLRRHYGDVPVAAGRAPAEIRRALEAY